MIQSWQIYALLSAIFAALVAIFAKQGFNAYPKLDPTLVTTLRAIIMAIFLTAVTLFIVKNKELPPFLSKTFFYIILSAFSGALSWLFYFIAISNAPKNKISTVAALDRLSVAFIFILTLIFFGNNITISSILGLFLLTIGAILMTIK